METKLFDRYVHEVGRRLPKRQRADVQAELHSLLMDALQDRVGEETEDKDGLETAQVAILEEFGPPAKVAAGYTPPHRYLIGPRVYDLYLIVAAAVAGSLSLVFLVILPLLTMWGEQEPLSALLSYLVGILDDYLGILLAGLGSVTLTFAILERVLPESALDKEDEETWDPRTLPEIEDTDRTRVKIGGLIVETVLTVIALIVFNFFPQWLSVSFTVSLDDTPARWYTIPVLAPVFFTTYLPLINISWILQIVLNVVLLRQSRWQLVTRLVDIFLTAFGAFILYRLITGPAFLTFEAISQESLRQLLDSFLPTLIKLGLTFGLIATIGEIIQKLYHIFRDKLWAATGLSNEAA
ncbi:MAG: hypothetical protein JW918_04650 [Anaerolineae bacterium]|nr:hypothetical protein [Anaerolineae bacterium]